MYVYVGVLSGVYVCVVYCVLQKERERERERKRERERREREREN